MTRTDLPRSTDTGLARKRGEQIMLAHGGGGQLTDQLVSETVLPRLGNSVLNQLLDAAMMQVNDQTRLAMSIDGYVVQPWRFPGGDIGRLAVCGTVNDLAVSGAKPLGIALGMIMAEGFAREDFEVILDSIATACLEANVTVVTGDTKVVKRGECDGIFITTAGVGLVPRERELSPRKVAPGDVLLINGPIGEHGLAVMLAREMPQVRSVLRTDAAPLNGLIASLLEAVPQVVFMRDPTRGGLAGVAADLARESLWHVELDEAAIPLRTQAVHAADMLGFDPLDLANEGKVVVVVRPDDAQAALAAMRRHPLGGESQAIGRVTDVNDGVCELATAIGGRRVVQKLYGEQLPRIC